MKKNRILLLLLLSLLFAGFTPQIKAQEKLAIFQIFDKYGREDGVTTLEASEGLMKEYNITLFKSIIFEDGTKALPSIRTAIEKDKKNAAKIKEEYANGLLMSGYYRLSSTASGLNRYLILKVGKHNSITLLYIEGKISPEKLVELLK
jgi:hypothetical protein